MCPDRRFAPKPLDRRALLARLHIARKEMALTEDSYRGVLVRITGHDSAKACSDVQLVATIEEFRRLGWKPKKFRPSSNKAFTRMIYGLWEDLKPDLKDSSEDALRSFVRRQTRDAKAPDGVDAPEWLDAEQATKVIEGLKAWRARLAAARRRAEAV